MDQTIVIAAVTIEFRITDVQAVNYAACAIVKAAQVGALDFDDFLVLRKTWMEARDNGRTHLRKHDLEQAVEFGKQTYQAFSAVLATGDTFFA